MEKYETREEARDSWIRKGFVPCVEEGSLSGVLQKDFVEEGVHSRIIAELIGPPVWYEEKTFKVDDRGSVFW